MVNRTLDKLVRPHIRLGHRALSSFRICGYLGLACAVLLTMSLALRLKLSLWVMGVLAVEAVLTFFGLAMAAKILTGEERLVYYHHKLAVILVATVLLCLLRQPVLPYLDIMVLGVGLFLACGRVGCLMVGCCHGRPCRWGVCYGKEYSTIGFTPDFVGIRLFPIQALESLWVLGIVFVGSVLVLWGYPAGVATDWYVVSYAGGRFCFEFMRGDAERPYVWGFSEAQWTSIFLLWAVVWTELAGALPYRPWHLWATAALVLIIISLAAYRAIFHSVSHSRMRTG
jgi:hypothetical protein